MGWQKARPTARQEASAQDGRFDPPRKMGIEAPAKGAGQKRGFKMKFTETKVKVHSPAGTVAFRRINETSLGLPMVIAGPDNVGSRIGIRVSAPVMTENENEHMQIEAVVTLTMDNLMPMIKKALASKKLTTKAGAIKVDLD